MFKAYSLILSLCLYGQSLHAQQWSVQDTIYSPMIASVEFHVSDDPLAFPMLSLAGGRQLRLAFDDMRGGFTDLKYSVQHCDKNWQPSQLTTLEYLNGFEEERLRDFAYSVNTYEDYTHYELSFPNNDMSIRVSGNYLLHVYQDDNRNTPLLTRRFLVAENLFKVSTQLKNATDASKYRTHQEMDIVLSHKDIWIVNPMNEVTLTILQNNRWQHAMTDIAPRSVRGEEIYYDYFDKIVFPGAKQFRNLDIRNLLFRTEKVASINEYTHGIDVDLLPERSRDGVNYLNYRDANGKFVILDQDRNQTATQGQYALVRFTLESPEVYGSPAVYVCGGMTDWKLQNRFRMEYNEERKAYTLETMLKQGYYEYYYVTSADGYNYTHDTLEGNWSETENEYLILVYYRPYGERYDRLVGYSRIKTNS